MPRSSAIGIEGGWGSAPEAGTSLPQIPGPTLPRRGMRNRRYMGGGRIEGMHARRCQRRISHPSDPLLTRQIIHEALLENGRVSDSSSTVGVAPTAQLCRSRMDSLLNAVHVMDVFTVGLSADAAH